MELISMVFIISVLLCRVYAFSSKQIKNRFDILEDRIHDESQLRRDDFNMLLKNVESMETLLRQFLDNESFPSGSITTIVQDQTKQLEEKIEKLSAIVLDALNSEKKLNVRFRRRVPEIFVILASLKRHIAATDKNCAQILHDLSNEVKNMTKDIEFHANNSENTLKENGVKLDNTIKNIEENQAKYNADRKRENKQLYKNITMEISNMREKVENSDNKLKNQFKNLKKGINHIEENQLKHLTELKIVTEETNNTRQKVENFDTALKTINENLIKGVSEFKENQTYFIGELKTDNKVKNECWENLLKEKRSTDEKVAEWIAVNKHQYEDIYKEINIIEKNQAICMSKNTEQHAIMKCNPKEYSIVFSKINENALISLQSYFIGSSCLNYYDTGFREDGVYQIQIEKINIIKVYCDMTTDGGGWTVFQRRKDGSVNFYRNWADYKSGFGHLLGEFWLGNDYLNLLTELDMSAELRIDLIDHVGDEAYAKYSNFKVGNERESYKLIADGYSGNAGDSLEPHIGMFFTTSDNDNDNNIAYNCATSYQGSWWYNSCAKANLNGVYDCKKTNNRHKCITWRTWRDPEIQMRFTEMKLR